MCSRECLRVARFFPWVEEYAIGSERDYDIFLWEKSTCSAFPGNISRLIPVKLSYLPGDIPCPPPVNKIHPLPSLKHRKDQS